MASKGYKTVLRIKGSTGNMEDDKVVNATSYINKKGKRKFYDVSDVYVDTQGNRLGTMNVPTIQQRKKAAEEQDRQRLGIKSVEQTQKTLKQADKEFDVASRKFENALSKELQKTGIDYRTRFEDMSKKKISYQTKNEDKPKNQPTPIPIVETSRKLKKELAEKEKAYNKWKIANYENDLAEVYDEKTTTWDKTGGHVTRALKDLVSPLATGDDRVLYDENGNKTFLPSRSELKQQKVRSEMSGVGGALADIGYNATKILGAGAIDLATAGIGGKALYWTDMATDNYKNVINQGYSNKDAIANTIISTGSEFLTEKMLGGLAKPLTGAKVSGTQKVFANAFYKATKNPRIANLLGSMTSEGLEEFTQEFIGALNNKITLGQDTNIDDLVQDALYSGLIGMGSGGLVTGAMGNAEGRIAEQQLNVINNNLTDLNALQETNNSKRVTNAINASQEFANNPFTTDYAKTMEKVSKLNEVEREALTQITQKRLAGEMLDQNDLDTINYLNNRDEMQTDLSTKTQGVAPQELKPIDTSDKILNFRNSVENEGIQDADGFYKAAEKIIQDKDYNVIMDSSITNEKGKPVNAVISNENGITIRINPKSERAAEILLMHEVTHGIETKEMSNLIMNYASKNAEFNDALESLKKAYGTEDITPEVVADISGQLFGRQDFINRLSTENPSIFKMIYDKIIELKNKLTGNANYDNFVKDLAVKWEKAYRKANTQSSQQNLKEGAKFSQDAEIGEKTKIDKAVIEKRAEVEVLDSVMENLIFDNEDIGYHLERAKNYEDFYKLALEDGIPKKDIPKPTEKIDEFVDDYEIEEWIEESLVEEARDTYMKYLDEYKNLTLREFLEAYENAQNTKTSDEYKQIEDISLELEEEVEPIHLAFAGHIWNDELGELLFDEDFMSGVHNYDDFHKKAAEHNIFAEKFPDSTTVMDDLTYDLYELADDFSREEIAKFRKMPFGEFLNYFIKDGTTVETEEEKTRNQFKKKNETSNEKMSDAVDSDGNKLSIGQEKHFKNSKVRDENGNLIKVYHTNKYSDYPFYEFKPHVAPDYHNKLFGNTSVIFASRDETMSGSYAYDDFIKADTKRYTKVSEIQDFLNKLNEISNNGDWVIDDASENNDYENYEGAFANELLRRFHRNIDEGVEGVKKLYDRGLITKEELEEATTPVKYAIRNTASQDEPITFISEDDLFRNWKNKLAKELNRKNDGNTNIAKWQYEGYLNIERPYIVDAQGRYWNEVTREINEKGKEFANSLTEKQKNDLRELVEESERKYAEYISEDKPRAETIFDIVKNIDDDSLLDILLTPEIASRINSYEDLYKEAKAYGMDMDDIPSPDTYMDSLAWVDYDYRTYDDYYYDQYFDMTLEDFIKEYKKYQEKRFKYGEKNSWFKNQVEELLNDSQKVLTNDILYNIVVNNFSETSIGKAFPSIRLSTNDIAKYIINENMASIEGDKYDGIIIKNVIDYGGLGPEFYGNKPNDIYIFFNSNQFKAVDNLNPTDDNDMRYSKNAKKWQEFLEKYFKNEGPKTILKDHIKKSKKQIKKDMIDKGVKPKVAEILTETPRAEEKKSSLREDWHKLKRKFVDKGEAVYRLAKKTKNRLLYAMYDKMGTSVGEANYHIGEAQTTLKGNAYRNFTDKEGKKVSMSLNQIWDGIDEKIANEYLAHYLNMDRYKQKNLSGENRYVFGESVTDKDSAKRVKELEKAHPELKRFGENVWQYGRNQLKNMVDSGMISKEQAEQFVLDTPHYVRLQRNVSKGSKNKIEVDKDGNARVNKQIKEFKGSDLDILPFKETMAQYTMDVIQSMRANLFGQELAKTLGMSATNDTVDSVDEIFGFNPDLIKDNGDGTYSFTIFNKGQAITVPIDEGIYEALQPNKKYDIEDAAIFSGKFGIRNADKFRRSLLTDKNPLFLATNMLKDLFDAPLNSQHPVAFAANYIPAIKQIVTNGKYYQQYKSLGGLQNTYFDHKEGFTKQRNKLNPVGWFEKANNAVEQFPRLAEFMATMKKTGNPEEAMYNAAEITTNFKRGGDITKAINRNGGTFLNASVQGFSRFVRNFTDIQNPQQAVKMLAKIIALGIGPALINDMVYDDDDEYKDLQDYIKDNYYLIKGKNGTWVRIPKGRAVSVFQDAARRTKYRLRGDKDAYKGLWSTFKNQVAPNNVFDSNIVSPFVQVAKNKSWSGNPIVSDYTKNAKHPEEEYDVKTDELSKWLGKTFHYSPKKINYIIDQYSGVIGDFALPIGTKYAESNSDSKLYQALVNPALNKFTTNSVTSSKAQQEFYQALQDAEDDRYWSKGTAKDTAVHKYLSSKNREISAIRSEMTALQESNKPDSEKFEGALEYQKQINEIAKDAVKQSKKIKETNKKEYEIGGNYYAGKDASAIKPETVEKAQNVGLSIGEWQEISTYKNEARADKRPDGSKIYGSAKQKVINYVYSKEELTEVQKKKILEQLYPKR